MNEDLKIAIVAQAKALGFDSCRNARCAPPPHADEYSQWLREGAEGEMDWLARGEEKRRNPEAVLPGARSVVVLGLSYWQGDSPDQGLGERKGRIARYAWGDDYHDVMLAKQAALAAFMQTH